MNGPAPEILPKIKAKATSPQLSPPISLPPSPAHHVSHSPRLLSSSTFLIPSPPRHPAPPKPPPLRTYSPPPFGSPRQPPLLLTPPPLFLPHYCFPDPPAPLRSNRPPPRSLLLKLWFARRFRSVWKACRTGRDPPDLDCTDHWVVEHWLNIGWNMLYIIIISFAI